MRTLLQRWAVIVALSVIVALAMALRLYNLDFGLPYRLHPDEPAKVRAVLNILSYAGHPRYFLHPAFMLYSLSGLALLTKLFTGDWPGILTLHLLGRGMVASLGTASVLIVYFVGRRLGQEWARWRAQRFPTASPLPVIIPDLLGLAAALFLAVCPLHVNRSHYLKEDVPLAFWTLLCMLSCLGIIRNGGRRNYVAAAVFAGLAMATKYTGLVSVALVVAAHFLHLRRRAIALPRLDGVVNALRLVGIGIAVFVLLNPFAVLDRRAFRKGARAEANHAFVYGHNVRVEPWQHYWTFHLRESLWTDAAPPLVVAALAGLALLAWRGGPAGLFIVCSGLTYYLVHEAACLKPPPDWSRYMVPVLPSLALGAGFLVLWPITLQVTALRRLGLCAGLGAAIAVAATGGAISCHQLEGMTPDTRILATEWAEANLPPGSSILTTNYGIVTDRVASRFKITSYSPSAAQQEDTLAGTYVPQHATKSVRIDYLVVSSFQSDRYERFADHSEYFENTADFFETLDVQWGPPLKTFRSNFGSYGFHNPTVKIYRRPGLDDDNPYLVGTKQTQ